MAKKSATQLLTKDITTLEFVTRDATGFTVTFDGIHEMTNTALGTPKGTPAPKGLHKRGTKQADMNTAELAQYKVVCAYWGEFAKIARDMTLQALAVCQNDTERAIVFDTSMRNFADTFKANKGVFGAMSAQDKAKDDSKQWETRCKAMGLPVNADNIATVQALYAQIHTGK